MEERDETSGDEAQGVWHRNLKDLYASKWTIQCALKGCVPCCYKFVIHRHLPHWRPNQRPETCRRFTLDHTSLETISGLYDKGMKILLVGDGNFSFSRSLARQLLSKNTSSTSQQQNTTVIATSHESQQSVLDTYNDAKEILAELKALGATVKHEIDATNADQLNGLGHFDRLIWNFPCVRMENGADGQNEQMEENKKLVKDFFNIASKSLLPDGEIHVTHKTKAPFSQWEICELAQDAGLKLVRSIVFDRCLYPGYGNRKVLSKGSFPIWDSQLFIFVPTGSNKTTVSSEDLDMESTSAEEITNSSTSHILPVTAALLDRIGSLLGQPQPIAPNKSKKRKKGRAIMPSTKKRK